MNSAPQLAESGTLDVPGGLSNAEAEQRLAEYGPNALPEGKPTSIWLRVLRQLQNALVYLLLLAVVADLAVWFYAGAHGTPVEALAIVLIIVLNASLGVLQEYRSESALAELRALSLPHVWVNRAGKLQRIASDKLVPADVVRLEAGDRIPADGSLCTAQTLSVDESLLTGESLAVEKELHAELLSGTLVVRGHGFFRVTATGAQSNMGKLAASLSGLATTQTPLERKIDELGRQISKYVGILACIMLVVGLLVEGVSRLGTTLMFVVAFAVAVVPEGMPAVITLALAVGVQRMAKRNAVVRRLAAVEALGSVTVIATDKTGTLTQNQMAVERLHARDTDEAITAMVLANDVDSALSVGDPVEIGLVRYAKQQGVDVSALRTALPRVSVTPFDSQWKFMRVTVKDGQFKRSYLKGAVEVILKRCTLTAAERTHWLNLAEREAKAGFRVLGLARGKGHTEENLELLGLVTLWDPPRAELPDALRRAESAGIHVVMITGDHPATARSIADKVGMNVSGVMTGDELSQLKSAELAAAVARTNVFARATPAHKLLIVETLQKAGHIVAMTGDGVNDAPALKRSDVGIAMGQRGSDVAREVSDLVLLDDNFATIVAAIEEGRTIYENIQKFVRFTFSTNIALMLLVFGAAVGSFALGLRDEVGALLLPLSALQILWINFLGDGPPALALAVDRNQDVMNLPPRPPNSPLLDRPSVAFILSTGAVKGLVGLALLVLLPAVQVSILATQTAVFTYESIAKLVSAYPSRRTRMKPVANAWLHVAIVAGVALQISCLLSSTLRNALHVVSMNTLTLGIVAIAVALTWAFGELVARRAAAKYKTSVSPAA
jgi:Ca2+-transporting ATPase